MEVYQQTTEFTGAAAALMMVISKYDSSFELSKAAEFRIWLESVNLPTRACSIFGLAAYAKCHGLKVLPVVGKLEYDYPDYRFKGYKKDEIEAAKFTSNLWLVKAQEQGVKIEVRDFGLGEVRQLLAAGKIIMLRLDTGVFREIRPSSNFVVVESYNKKYCVYDPYLGKLEIGEEEMQSSFDDLVTKRKRDHRMLVFG
ncbi:MAG: peptidase C39 family protein [Candidatus Woesearchaeota archaeon]